MTKSVVIIDDIKKMSDELKDEFVNGSLAKTSGYEFSVDQIFSVAELKENTFGLRRWDIIIIDRNFNEGNAAPAFKEKIILWAALALYVDAIKIIWTAWSNPENMKDCMRLGAWDYIEKTTASGNSTFGRVVQSAVNGIHHHERQLKQEQTRRAAEELARTDRDMHKQCAGKLVAIRDSLVLAKGSDMLSLLEDINNKGLDRETLTIVKISP